MTPLNILFITFNFYHLYKKMHSFFFFGKNNLVILFSGSWIGLANVEAMGCALGLANGLLDSTFIRLKVVCLFVIF